MQGVGVGEGWGWGSVRRTRTGKREVGEGLQGGRLVLHQQITQLIQQSQTPEYPTSWALLTSMRLAVFMVSPKMENLGRREPIMPLITGPECMPTRTSVGCPLCGILTVRAAASMSLANAITRRALSTGSCSSSTDMKPDPVSTTPPLTM